MLGRCYYNQKKYDEALEQFTKVYDTWAAAANKKAYLPKQEYKPLAWIAVCYEAKEDYAKAVEYENKCLDTVNIHQGMTDSLVYSSQYRSFYYADWKRLVLKYQEAYNKKAPNNGYAIINNLFYEKDGDKTRTVPDLVPAGKQTIECNWDFSQSTYWAPRKDTPITASEGILF
jgi:tetratricopeptide (TPR) repeat protein